MITDLILNNHSRWADSDGNDCNYASVITHYLPFPNSLETFFTLTDPRTDLLLSIVWALTTFHIYLYVSRELPQILKVTIPDHYQYQILVPPHAHTTTHPRLFHARILFTYEHALEFFSRNSTTIRCISTPICFEKPPQCA